MNNELKKYLNDFSNICKKTNVFLVLNAQKHTKKMSYYTIDHAIESEFFTQKEVEEIVSSLLQTGLYVNIFYTEMEFIDYILQHYSQLDKESLIIYNLARDGLKEGKKSLIPSFCDYFNLDYTGSNAFVVSLCRNKFIWTSILKNFGILVPKSIEYKDNLYIGEKFSSNRYIIKEISESASINLDEHSLLDYFDWNSKPNLDKFLVQEYIDGIEVEVPFFNINGKYIILNPVKIISSSSILTSQISDNYLYKFDKLSDPELINKIKIKTKKIAHYLNINTYGRIDFRIDKNKNIYVFDIATMPYTTKHSSFSYNFNNYNLSLSDIHKLIILSSL